MWAKALLVAKVIVAGYWLWVGKVLLLGADGAFEAIVALSAPLILSLHFLQALLLLRRLRSAEPYWKQLGQTLLFGALYLAPRMLAAPKHATRV